MKNRLLLILLLLVAGVCDGQIITTVAGNGISGSTGDGGPATSASINIPWFSRFDKSGNFYFIEGANSKIRKINILGDITTIAGTGTSGYNGDGIAATAAKLNNPSGIAFDRLGNLYIGDAANQRIRKVDLNTGLISTVAGIGIAGYSGDGNAATTAKLNYPYAICFDDLDNLYVCDFANYRVRKVDNNGIISTYAGKGTSGNSGDGGLAINAQFIYLKSILAHGKDIYVGDWNDAKIRKIDALGLITTFAGTGTNLYNGDSKPATSANIMPVDFTFNGKDELYIADNNRIRKIDVTGNIVTIAGNGVAGYNGDGGLATLANLHTLGGITVDSCSNIYVSEVGNSRIRKITFDNCIKITGVKYDFFNIDLSIYPTPTNDLLHINNLQTPATYKLLNMPGAVLQQGALKAGDNSISIEAPPAGMYMLEVVNAEVGVREVRKIVKQ